MASTDTRGLRGLVPLMAVSAVVVLTAWGLSRGVWVANVHNALLALSFSIVGCYVLFQRPGHREGVLFMAAGLVEAVMFFGRQIGHVSSSDSSRWWGWLGVWPVVVALALTTFAVLCFPDGRLPSRGWWWVGALVVAVTVLCAALSAVWPIEYTSAGVISAHPFSAVTPPAVAALWAGVAHPAYVGFQILWVVAVAVRWRSSGGQVRRQLAWVLGAAAVSVLALILGLVVEGTPVPGLLSTTLLPVAAGWAIVHGQHLAAYSALTWMSRTRSGPDDLPGDIAATAAEALGATGGILWVGPAENLHAVGVWPEARVGFAQTDVESLRRSPDDQVRTVTRHGVVVGALSISRARRDDLSLAQRRLFEDLAAQANLVIENLTLADEIGRQRRAGCLDGLTPREQDVLELMSLGLSNAAIGRELHLSIKTVEPVVSGIFAKLDLYADADSNRRVLAVLAFVRT